MHSVADALSGSSDIPDYLPLHGVYKYKNIPTGYSALPNKKTIIMGATISRTRGSEMPQKADCAGSNKVSDCCN